MKERILYLFMQYYTNKSTRAELDEFFRVIQEAKHDEEINALIKLVYDEIKQSNPSLTYINEAGKLVLQEPDWLYQPASPEPEVKLRNKPLFHNSWYAAAGMVLILVGLLLWQFRSSRENHIVLVKKFTGKAEYKFLLLNDSTKVWLNASSSINFPEKFSADKREVYLTGEAYFDVKHADKVPFIIHTGKVKTVVLGTAFNIKAYPDQQNITVAVKRGKVCILKDDLVVSTLIKDQEVKIERKGKHQIVQKDTGGSKAGAWQLGHLAYEDEHFADIISDLARVYNADIKLNAAELQTLRITTSFNRDIGLKKALQILCKLTDSKLENYNNQYLITHP